MNLRLDLLKRLTEADVAEALTRNNHRYEPEPRFSKTGTGSLSSASIEERAKEEELSSELRAELENRSESDGMKSEGQT